jgi:hypothetical protein
MADGPPDLPPEPRRVAEPTIADRAALRERMRAYPRAELRRRAFDTVTDPAEAVPNVLEALDRRYRIECDGCELDAVRDTASPVVKRPDGHRCPDCGDGLRVRHVASGRTWTTPSGYWTARAAVDADADESW